MKNSQFSPEELLHYSRQLMLRNFSFRKQQALKDARILVVGAGGLGCPALLYLAAAGVGNIGIVEDDVVEISNLQRQTLFTYSDVGKKKGAVAAEKLKQTNKFCNPIYIEARVNDSNIFDILPDYDIVVDATDNFQAKYLLNDVCYFLGKPLIYASISQFEGQICVFDFSKTDAAMRLNLRDIFPEPPPKTIAQDCSEAGVFGFLPGVIGTIQASEVVKLITGDDRSRSGELILFDVANLEINKFAIRANTKNPLRSISTEEGLRTHLSQTSHDACDFDDLSMAPEKVQSKLKTGERVQLVDVREDHEHAEISIGGVNIPASVLASGLALSGILEKGLETIVYCRSGKRSASALPRIEAYVGLSLCRSLRGGLNAYVASGCRYALRGKILAVAEQA